MHTEGILSAHRPPAQPPEASAEASRATRHAPRRRRRVIAAVVVVAGTIVAAVQGQAASSSAQSAVTVPAAPAGVPLEAPTVAPPPRVAYVGDSIGHSAETEVRQSLADGYRLMSYDSVDGSAIAEHLDPVTRLLRINATPDILVIELGTNDAEHHGAVRFERDLRTMLDLVSPRVREVRWLDQKDTPTYYAGVNHYAVRFNAILRRVVAQYPNVEIVDYAAWARTAPADSFFADQLHLTPRGCRQLAAIVRQAVDRAAGELGQAVT